MSSWLLEYYGRRAREYERIYDKPERAEDLARLADLARRSLTGEQVLELACGTGYWTARIAPVATSICAIDAAAETLELARQKVYPSGRVRLELGDAYALERVAGKFTAACAGFWWSHVPRQDLSRFLQSLHRRLGAGARVVFWDNRFVPGNSTPIARIDASGNSYQRRRLDGGKYYEVLKNFPAATELDDLLRANGGTDVSLIELTYYWFVTYRVGEAFL